jgi:hypothetical protein
MGAAHQRVRGRFADATHTTKQKDLEQRLITWRRRPQRAPEARTCSKRIIDA